MLANVLDALRKSGKICEITVVSADRRAAALAHRHGAKFLWEGRQRGLNNAVKLALGKLEDESGAALIVHADLPLITPRDINRLIAKSSDCQIAIVPCKNGTGTNALLLSPPYAITPVFGEGSCTMHINLAKDSGLPWKLLRIRGIQFDIDDLRDLGQFIQHNGWDRRFRFLHTATQLARSPPNHGRRSAWPNQRDLESDLNLLGRGGNHNFS